MIAECGPHASFVVVVSDLVGHDGDVALLSLGGNEDGALANVDRTWRRFNDDERGVDRTLGQAREGADTGFEVGNDDRG